MLNFFCRGFVSSCILFALPSINIFSQHQDISFKHLTINDGLSNNNVLSIWKDYKGFIWIGTEDGLNKYDGYDFTIFRKEEKNPSSLSHNYCLKIYEDKSHNLWIGTRRGLNLYNRDRNNFERFYCDSAQKYSQIENSIQNIFEDSKNNLWVCTLNGLYQFNRQTKQFKRCLSELKDNNQIYSGRFRGVVEDKDHNLWIGCYGNDNGALIQLKDDKIVNIFQHNPANPNSISSNSIYCLFIDSKNNLWIGTRASGLNKYDIEHKSFKIYKNDSNASNTLSSNSITAIAELPKGRLWLNSSNGLNILNSQNNKIDQIFNNSDDNSTILSNNLVTIFVDDQKSVWLGSRSGGVDIYNKCFNLFKHYHCVPKTKYTLSFNNVSSFAEDHKGNIWIATDGGGLNCFNPVTEKFISYSTANKKIGLPNDKTISVLFDKDNTLWVGTWLGGIVTYKIDGENLILHNKYPYFSSKYKFTNSVFSFYQTRNGDIYIASWIAGLYKFDKINNLFVPVLLNKNSGDQPIPTTDCIFEDHKGNLWIGSEDKGLFAINNGSGNIENFTYDEYSASSISSTSVFCIYEDRRSLIWLGTDFGLNLFDPVKKKSVVFTEKDGLPSNYIYGILEDNGGHLWISTSKGLSKVEVVFSNDEIALNCKNYDVIEGLQGLQFNRWAYYKSRKGIMYFGGYNGFNAFCPDSIEVDTTVPPVYISGLNLFNKPVLPGPGSPLNKWISETDEINLPSSQKVITIQFTAINYLNPHKNEYKYKLEGFDKDWNYIGRKREVTYTNLPAGHYIFRVIASNIEGQWNNKGATLKLTIIPPFWNTWWFKTMLLFLILVLIVGFYFNKTAQILKRSELMEKLVRQRTFEVNSQKEEIEKINIMLIEQKNELEAQTEELQSQAEELFNHSEALEKSNMEIQKQRDDLRKAYEELNKYRNQLEDLVIERTRDLNNAKDKAEESDKLKSAFLANMSHEIRTPLNAIIGFAKLLNSISFNEKEKTEFISIIEQNSNYLLSLVDDILDISKIESGIIKLNYISIELNQILRDIDYIYNEEIKKLEKHNISINFKTNLSSELLQLKIFTDPIRLRQIITNLINNALKYTKAGFVEFGGKILDENNLLFYVKDTGLGIKKGNLDLIFDRFRKFEESTTEIHRGTGLGLAIVKQLVELMQGKIWVESEYGIGSTFYFTLPNLHE